jgi:hypothetical protein
VSSMAARTRHKSWALCAAAWMTGCALIWIAIPVRPTAILPAEYAGEPIQFSTDGRILLTQDHWVLHPEEPRLPTQLGGNSPTGPYRLWDAANGRHRLTWPPRPGAVLGEVAPDGNTAVVYQGRTPSLVDVRSGRSINLPWRLRGSPCAFSRDGRFFVDSGFCDQQVDTVWWDRQEHRIVAVFPGTELVALAGDGKWASIARPHAIDQSTVVTVRAPITGQQFCQYKRDKPLDQLFFSADGSYMIAEDRDTVEIVNAADGRLCVRLPAPSRNVMVLGRLQKATSIEMADSGEFLVWWDLRSGRAVRRQALDTVIPPGAALTSFEAVPECERWFLQCSTGRTVSPFEKWLPRIPFVESSAEREHGCCIVVDARTGGIVVLVPGAVRAIASPDGHTLVVQRRDCSLELWNGPPQKSWKWLTLAAIVWTLPVAWLAQRIPRRLNGHGR